MPDDDFSKDWAQFRKAAERLTPTPLNTSPDNASKALVQLVLALVNLIRELMEKQAIRRMEGDTLTDEEIERLGLTFMRLEETVTQLREQFGLSESDLRLERILQLRNSPLDGDAQG